MDRLDWYYKRVVTEGDLDLRDDQVEAALQNLVLDSGAVGLRFGGDLVEASPTPNLTVELETPCGGYDQEGNRIYIASLDPIDISVDSDLVSTDVSGPGKERWVSVFVQYDVVLSDEQIDGNSNPVFFMRSASYRIIVIQGAEADEGLAVPTALLPDALLLADILRYNAQTQILNEEIFLNRQQVAFALSSSNYDILAGTEAEALEGMLQILDDHIAQTANAHTADNIQFDPTGTNFNPLTVDVAAAFDEVGVLAAPHPGNLWTTANRLRTHGAFADWRDDADTRAWTLVLSETIPGGGGTIDMKLGSTADGDYELGYSEFDQTGLYQIVVDAEILAPPDTTSILFTRRKVTYHGTVQRSGANITLLTPTIDQNVGGANITSSFVILGNILFLRATANAALAGLEIRFAANLRRQFIRTTA